MSTTFRVLLQVVLVASPFGHAPLDAAEPEAGSGGVCGDTDRLFVSAFVWQDEKRYDTKIVEVDPRTGDWQTLDDDFGPFAVSRDGARMFVDRDEAGLWLVDVATGGPGRRIAGRRGFPTVAPDGRSVLVSRTRVDGPGIPETYSSRVERVTTDGRVEPVEWLENLVVVDWSTKGRLLVSDPNDERLFTAATDGRDRRPFEVDPCVNPVFLPDGRRVLYVVPSPGLVRVVDLERETIRTMYESTTDEFATVACWSPDGRTIAAVLLDTEEQNNGPRVPLADPRSSNPHIVLIDVASGRSRPLTLRPRDGRRAQPADYGIVWR